MTRIKEDMHEQSVERVVDLERMRTRAPIEVLLHWVREREAVRIRKEAGGTGSLTDDPIIRAWRFCNVRREDDRVTRWIDENIRKRYAGHRYLWLMLCIGRMINWPPTLDTLIRSGITAWPSDDDFVPLILGEVLEGLATFQKVFGGAYIIPAPQLKGHTKGKFIAEYVIGNLWKERAKFERHFNGAPNLRSTHALLASYPYWGDFLSYQAIVDMRFTPLLSEADDVAKWCAVGPGTMRGLNRLVGRPLDRKITQDVGRLEVRDLWPEVVGESGVQMDLSDAPNVLCEFDKYMRVLHGEGEPKARYVPGRGS